MAVNCLFCLFLCLTVAMESSTDAASPVAQAVPSNDVANLDRSAIRTPEPQIVCHRLDAVPYSEKDMNELSEMAAGLQAVHRPKVTKKPKSGQCIEYTEDEIEDRNNFYAKLGAMYREKHK